MKKLVIAAQEHFLDNYEHELHIVLVGMPREHFLPEILMFKIEEMREIGPFICVNCPEIEMIDIEEALKRLDFRRVGPEIGLIEQLPSDLLAGLNDEVVTMDSLLIKCRNEPTVERDVLFKNKTIYRPGKTPLKNSFNSRSRQISKSVRRKK